MLMGVDGGGGGRGGKRGIGAYIHTFAVDSAYYTQTFAIANVGA